MSSNHSSFERLSSCFCGNCSDYETWLKANNINTSGTKHILVHRNEEESEEMMRKQDAMTRELFRVLYPTREQAVGAINDTWIGVENSDKWMKLVEEEVAAFDEIEARKQREAAENEQVSDVEEDEEFEDEDEEDEEEDEQEDEGEEEEEEDVSDEENVSDEESDHSDIEPVVEEEVMPTATVNSVATQHGTEKSHDDVMYEEAVRTVRLSMIKSLTEGNSIRIRDQIRAENAKRAAKEFGNDLKDTLCQVLEESQKSTMSQMSAMIEKIDDISKELEELKTKNAELEKLREENVALKKELLDVKSTFSSASQGDEPIEKAIQGDWQIVYSDNMEEYLKQRGACMLNNIIFRIANHHFELKDGMIKMHQYIGPEKFLAKNSKLDEQYKADVDLLRTTFILDNALYTTDVQASTGNSMGKEKRFVRNGMLHQIRVRNGVTCTRVYERIVPEF